MRILVTGGSGFVGFRVARSLAAEHVVHATYRNHPIEIQSVTCHELDITDGSAVERVFAASRPSLVIHASALTNVDLCEARPDLAASLNVDGTRNVMAAAERYAARIIFLSSSFVFDGRKDCFAENDRTCPVNVYGATKAKSEADLRAAHHAHAIVRIDQPYGWSKPWQHGTMIDWVLKKLDTGVRFPVFVDWHNTPTYVEDIVRALKVIAEDGLEGTFNVVGPDFISRYDWSVQIARTFARDASLIEPGCGVGKGLARRPNVRLANARTTAQVGLRFRGIGHGMSLLGQI